MGVRAPGRGQVFRSMKIIIWVPTALKHYKSNGLGALGRFRSIKQIRVAFVFPQDGSQNMHILSPESPSGTNRNVPKGLLTSLTVKSPNIIV